MPCILKRLTIISAAGVLTACAAKVVPDPRAPGVVRDPPVMMTVCFVEGDGAHLSVGDRVELATSRLGRLRIRHLPGPNNKDGAWNEGDDARVNSVMLVERISDDNKRSTRRFVPAGRFRVEVPMLPGHVRFDFLASKVTSNPRVEGLPECDASIGDDEVLIRGVGDRDRHGGLAHLRTV